MLLTFETVFWSFVSALKSAHVLDPQHMWIGSSATSSGITIHQRIRIFDFRVNVCLSRGTWPILVISATKNKSRNQIKLCQSFQKRNNIKWKLVWETRCFNPIQDESFRGYSQMGRPLDTTLQFCWNQYFFIGYQEIF